jgi:hypothetical protein
MNFGPPTPLESSLLLTGMGPSGGDGGGGGGGGNNWLWETGHTLLWETGYNMTTE